MENKEEKPVQTNEAFEAYQKAVSELKDGPFKDFYQKNPDEMQRLFNKVDIKDLVKFSASIFSLVDVWECLYTASLNKNLNFTTEVFYEMVRDSLLTKLTKKGNKTYEANKVFEEYEEVVGDLKDGSFKDFYQNNPKEMEYLFNNVNIKELKKFDKNRFSLVDIWECLYTASLKRNLNFTTEDFKEKVLAYKRIRMYKNNVPKTVKIGEWYVKKTSLIDCIEEDVPEKIFPNFKYFKKTKNKELDKVLKYAFNGTIKRTIFGNGKRYKISPVEAMFMFFVFDDKYQENVDHIKYNEGKSLIPRFIKGLYRYAAAISEEKNISHDGTNSLGEIYEGRKKELQPDLTEASNKLQEALNEYRKGNKADLGIVIKKSKECRTKLKKFIKRVEKLKRDTD